MSQTHYAGAFTPTTSNASVATIAAGSTAGTFTVTSTGGGTATVSIAGGGGQTATYTVSVAVTTISPSAWKAQR